jgi:hypothetical protein
MTKRIIPTCRHCGSENVRADAYAAWSVDSQQWEIVTIFENTDCEDCGGETSLDWKGIDQ